MRGTTGGTLRDLDVLALGNRKVERNADLLEGGPTRIWKEVCDWLSSAYPLTQTQALGWYPWRTEEELRTISQHLELAPNLFRRDSAVYVAKKHAIIACPPLLDCLEHARSGVQLHGVYLIVHEWFHALRQHPASFFPLEEGGAEVFAQAVIYGHFGVKPSIDALEAYSGFKEGVWLLTEWLGTHPLAWLLKSRTQPDPHLWLEQELTRGGLTPETAELTAWYDVTKGMPGAPEWLEWVQGVVK